MNVRTRLVLLAAPVLVASSAFGSGTVDHLVEITAARDNTFRVAGEKSPVIRAHPGELLRLQVTSQQGSEAARDGAVHSLVIRSLRDEGWDIRLYEGTHDYEVKAPDKPGEYLIECTVKCGRGHDDMRMKLLVKK
jgi:hypothetical protein